VKVAAVDDLDLTIVIPTSSDFDEAAHSLQNTDRRVVAANDRREHHSNLRGLSSPVDERRYCFGRVPATALVRKERVPDLDCAVDACFPLTDKCRIFERLRQRPRGKMKTGMTEHVVVGVNDRSGAPRNVSLGCRRSLLPDSYMASIGFVGPPNGPVEWAVAVRITAHQRQQLGCQRDERQPR